MFPVSLDYAGIREFSDLLGEAEGDVLGLVIGARSPAGIVVLRYEPLRSAPGADPHDALGVRESMVQFLQMCAADATPGTGQPVGLFRTQQGGLASITDFDNRLIRRCLPYLAPSGKFFMVIRNFAHRPRSGALFPLETAPPPVAARPGSGISLRRIPAAQRLPDRYIGPDNDAEGIAAANDGNAGANDDGAAVPGGDPRPLASRNDLRMAGVVLLALLAGAGVWKWYRGTVPQPMYDVQDNSAPPPGLSLKVGRSGRDMEISWNRFSEAAKNASGGTLTIRDGPIVRVVALNSAQLREGHIWFTPLPGSDLDLRLEVSKRDGKTQAESVQVLSWDSGSTATSVAKVTPVSPDRSKDRAAEPAKKPPAVSPATQTPATQTPATQAPTTQTPTTQTPTTQTPRPGLRLPLRKRHSPSVRPRRNRPQGQPFRRPTTPCRKTCQPRLPRRMQPSLRHPCHRPRPQAL